MNPWLIGSLKFLGALTLMLVNGVVLIYMLRKVLGRLHIRLGPMDNGPWGLLQTPYDVLKLLAKEDPTPAAVDKALFWLAPAMVFVPSLMAYIVLPFSGTMSIANLPLGLLFVFAVMSLIPLGILMAGWASNNKWSLIGAMRAVGGQVAYEVPLLMAALPVAMMAGSLNMTDIVNAQQGLAFGFIPKWFIWNFPAFVLFLIAGLIETGQTPFDMAEAESELVAGFATEYASMRFGLLFLSEFSNTFIFSALMVTLFFGGWGLPWVPDSVLSAIGFLPPVVFVLKTYFVIFLLMIVRGTLPRVRVDQMLALGWKALLPASLAWVLITGLFIKVAQAVTGS